MLYVYVNISGEHAATGGLAFSEGASCEPGYCACPNAPKYWGMRSTGVGLSMVPWPLRERAAAPCSASALRPLCGIAQKTPACSGQHPR